MKSRLYKFTAGLILIASVQSGALLTAQPFQLFAVNDLVRVFEDGYNLPPKDDTIKLFGIRGEIISGQFAIQAQKDIDDVFVEITSLADKETGDSFPVIHTTWDFVGSVLLPSNAPNQPPDAVVRQAPARFPDYLMREKRMDIKSKKYQAVWLTIEIPKNAPEGNFEGLVTVKSVQGEKTLPLSLTIYPITLPEERHLKIAVRYSLNRIEKYHGVKKYSDDWYEVLKRYADNMASHRQNVIQASLGDIEIGLAENGDLHFDFTRYDEFIQIFMNTGKMDFIETGYGLTRFGEGDWFSTEIVLSDFPVKDLVTGKTVIMPGEKIVPYLLPALESHMRIKGWLDITLLSVRNEPSLHNAIPYVEMSDYFHHLAPDLKQFESLETTMTGGVDIPGPKLDHLATWYDSFREAQLKGTEVCYYIVGIYQGSRYPNKTIDVPIMDSRIMPWLNYKYNLSGIKHWGWNSWTEDPFNDVGQHLGDGWHVYPVPGGVLNSLRWEQMRNGIQDYEYLYLLREKIQALKDSLGTRFSWIDPDQRGREIAGKVVMSFSDRTKDPETLYKAKKEIISELLEFDTSPGVYIQTIPEENSTITSHSSVEVFGWADPGTTVIVNGQELPVSSQGLFLEVFQLDHDQSFIRAQATSGQGTKVIERRFAVK
jgi:hypothetical protein